MSATKLDAPSAYPPPPEKGPLSAPLEEAPLPTYTESDAAELFSPTSSALPPSYVPFTKAIALPQSSTQWDAPITRAYSPALKDAGISQEDWLAFLDGFNTALIGSPPLQVVDLVGKILGFVPSLWFSVASAGAQIIAGTGQHIISKTLTDRYLKHNNKEFFAPRGLVVRLVKGRALRQLVEKDARTGEPSALAKTGAVATTVGLHLPIVRKILNRALPDPAISRHAFTPGADQSDRRLASLEGYIQPVDRDVPPARTPKGLMEKSSSLAVKMRMSDGKRADRKLELAAVRRVYGVKKATGSSTDRFDKKAYKAERRAARDVRKGREPRTNNKQKLRDRNAQRSEDGLVWLVVLTKEQDELIHGKEDADGDEDLVMSEGEFEEEMEREREEQQEEDEEEAELSKAPLKN